MSNMVVNTNVLALNSHRNLGLVGAKQAKSSQKLSSGLRINSAADDAAGLAISEKMRAQIGGLNQASRNTQDAQSLVQTAEGGMEQVTEMVKRMRDLNVQAGAGVYTKEDLGNVQAEIDSLTKEIDSMVERVEFNEMKVLDGGRTTQGITSQLGANSGQTIDIKLEDMSTTGLGINFGSMTDVTTITASRAAIAKTSAIASAASTPTKAAVKAEESKASVSAITAVTVSANLEALDGALSTITTARANLGAIQNRLDYTKKSLDISSENLSASESRIRDTDMAKEMMNLTKSNVLQQAATSMLAQANQAPQNVLQLLG
ncbi:MAG: flagellin [Lachnospirales bacterium]